MTIGGRIAKARARKGLTLDELAERLGLTRVAVNNWERGVNNPTTARLGDIARELDVTPQWLLSGGDDDFVTRAPRSPEDEKWREAIVVAEQIQAARRRRLSPDDTAELVLVIHGLMIKKKAGEKFDLAEYDNIIDFALARR